MALQTLVRKQKLGISIAEAWDFLSNPANLALITPPDMKFTVRSDLPDRIYEGLIIEYRVRPLLSIPVTWITEITHVSKPTFFVDEQRIGPYRMWHHEHRLREVADGTEMTDRVSYVLPYGPIGDIASFLIVKARLERIFDFRRDYLKEKFGEIA